MAALAGGPSGLGGVVATPDLNPNAINPGGTATATLSLTNAGAYSATNDLSGNYCTPTTLASQLDVRLTVNTGTNPTGSALATWLNLGTNRSWTLTATAGTIRQAVCTLEIRETATGIVRDTSSVTFDAEGV